MLLHLSVDVVEMVLERADLLVVGLASLLLCVELLFDGVEVARGVVKL